MPILIGLEYKTKTQLMLRKSVQPEVAILGAVDRKECGLWLREWASHCLVFTWFDFCTSVADKKDNTSVTNGKVKEEPVCVSVF